MFSRELFQEVFLNPGLVLLFGGILIGLISGLQGQKVVAADDRFFVLAFQGVLCLFLLEMGMTASRKLKDLRSAGRRFHHLRAAGAEYLCDAGDHRRLHLRLPDPH